MQGRQVIVLIEKARVHENVAEVHESEPGAQKDEVAQGSIPEVQEGAVPEKEALDHDLETESPPKTESLQKKE